MQVWQIIPANKKWMIMHQGKKWYKKQILATFPSIIPLISIKTLRAYNIFLSKSQKKWLQIFKPNWTLVRTMNRRRGTHTKGRWSSPALHESRISQSPIDVASGGGMIELLYLRRASPPFDDDDGRSRTPMWAGPIWYPVGQGTTMSFRGPYPRN